MRSFLRTLLRRMGFEVSYYSAAGSEHYRLRHLLQHHRIGMVADVGANAGQFATGLFSGGYGGHVLSFEPQQAEHTRLQRLAARHPTWQVAPRCALGAQPGTATLHVAGNSVSSSMLPMQEVHTAAAPESRYTRHEEVPVRCLDEFLTSLTAHGPLLLKLDTQGFERPILQGGRQVLQAAQVVYLEMCLQSLYEGQALFDELHQLMLQQGFMAVGFSPCFADNRTGHVLAVDGTYARRA